VKPALEKFLIISATLAAIGIFVFVALWSSIKEKKTQMDTLFNSTNVPTSYQYTPAAPGQRTAGGDSLANGLEGKLYGKPETGQAGTDGFADADRNALRLPDNPVV
jgi:hypothetical protein